MANPPDNRQVTIRIGGDASGPVIVGDRNRVETREPAQESPGEEAKSEQRNTAKDHGTVYAVTQGDMHVHHTGAPLEAQEDPPETQESQEAPVE
ncbi:hypothetical protein OHS33_24850 [Streptomyces sp. NBC_00536]|uniref:hypothetical protein n=1 Tax=Streptomyces sp. NBC_00536 TaxID=2975769 RepID=UPI002E816E6A|nr:hypothetical protein [Streptomyces sp. NBC_00536]WUC81279.1 hypothetical protein OHS33_24850 [Streptomyces sp. NBC_00536]